MFTEMLDRVLNGTPGAVSVTLMGFDGIAIETREAGPTELNHQAAAVELGNIAKQLRGISEGLGTGDMNELTVQTGELTTVLRPLTDEYFVAISMAPTANFGKGRYLLRVVGPELTKELV
jgi:predicted regulator of Ras-like GTPase activity (Roadblock/LC7/MglB family)